MRVFSVYLNGSRVSEPVQTATARDNPHRFGGDIRLNHEANLVHLMNTHTHTQRNSNIIISNEFHRKMINNKITM